jgi:prepilin-type N-terminal cleavage/methylation domain-containing protein
MLKISMKSRRGNAFTLIEMLIVIAVIAILATLLAPAISQAKTRAKNALCKNNIREVGLALHQYVATYDAYTPDGFMSSDSVTSWQELLAPYV